MRISTIVTLGAAALAFASMAEPARASVTRSSGAAASVIQLNNQGTTSLVVPSVPGTSARFLFTLASTGSTTCTQGGPEPLVGQPTGGSTSKKRHSGPLIQGPCNPPPSSPAPPRPHS